MANRLTVLIPCKDERMNIRPCIESLHGLADEILIADSGSTDGTLEIVRQIGGCRVIEREYIHSGDFKNWAIPQARYPWVLIVDADERVGRELGAEIRRILATGPRYDGYWIFRENYFLGHRIRFSGWQTDKVLRFLRRAEGRYFGENDHAEVTVRSGRVGRLKLRLRHFTYWSCDQYFKKFHRYTTYQAQLWYDQGRRPNALRMLATGPLRFLHTYFIRLGILDGLAGFQVCMLTAFGSYMKQARLWELCNGKRQPDPEANRPCRAVTDTALDRPDSDTRQNYRKAV